MDVQNKTLTDREGFYEAERLSAGLQVTRHFHDIRRLRRDVIARCGLHHIRKGCLRTFDTRARDSLTSQVRTYEKFRVADQNAQTLQVPKSGISRRQRQRAE